MSEDAELNAIEQLLSALDQLDSGARGRVLDYVFRRLDIQMPAPEGAAEAQALTSSDSVKADSRAATAPPGPQEIVDIRTLASEKKPTSQIEKTVFVAFYLSEIAPESNRKKEISGADLEKFQKQADLGAPTNTRQALFRARDAGYLESAGHGKYKLNPVGYNFVAHNLPSAKAKPGPAARRKGARKSTRKKATRKRSSRKPARKR